MIDNAGTRFQSNGRAKFCSLADDVVESFADEPLLERLRVLSTDSMTDPAVKKKAAGLFIQWNRQYENVQGLQRLAALSSQLPQRSRRPPPVVRPPSPHEDDEQYIDEDRDEEGRPSITRQRSKSDATTRPSSSSLTGRHQRQRSAATAATDDSVYYPRTKKHKHKAQTTNFRPINFETERPMILQTIASGEQASTNLKNALSRLDREEIRPSEDPQIAKYHSQCRQLRRQIILYIQRTESEEWIGTLIQVNEAIVHALQGYEIMNKPPEEDSDSEGWSDDGDTNTKKGGGGNRMAQEIAVRLRAQSLGSPKVEDERPPDKPPRPRTHDDDEEEELPPPRPIRPVAKAPTSPLLVAKSPPPRTSTMIPSSPAGPALKPKPRIPPKPANLSSKPRSMPTGDDDDDDDPFGDSHRVETATSKAAW